jgi:hypothetical protein
MGTLFLVLTLTGTAYASEIHDERSNRLALCAWRLALSARDGSIELRDPQGSRIGRTSTPRSDGSVVFEDAQSNRLGQGKPDATGRYQYQDRGSTRRGSGDASGPVWLRRGQQK